MNPDNISLRDYFAGLAMQTLMSKVPRNFFTRIVTINVVQLSEASYTIADAMLAERNKTGTSE